MVGEHPELVRGIVKATLHGLKDTLANPDKAFEVSLKYAPEAGKDENQIKTNKAAFDEVLKLWRAKESELGLSDPRSWGKAVKFMEKAGLINKHVDPKSCYTNEFVK